jgi:hypothetical protein
MIPVCIGCGKTPEEMTEYSKESTDSNFEPNDYVKREEGTYNPANGHFACTPCYIDMGMPSSPTGWKAP